jgi:hypothetical protein
MTVHYGRFKDRLQKKVEEEVESIRDALGLTFQNIVTRGSTVLIGQEVKIGWIVEPSDMSGSYIAHVVASFKLDEHWHEVRPDGEMGIIAKLEARYTAWKERRWWHK